MNYELDLTHGKAKWTRGQIFKVEVNPNLLNLDLRFPHVSQSTLLVLNLIILNNYIYIHTTHYTSYYAISCPQLLYSPRKCIYFVRSENKYIHTTLYLVLNFYRQHWTRWSGTWNYSNAAAIEYLNTRFLQQWSVI